MDSVYGRKLCFVDRSAKPLTIIVNHETDNIANKVTF